MDKQTNIVPHAHRVSAAERQAIKGHRPLLIWFTGLSGSGKSTLANALEATLNKEGVHTYLLDGDNIRSGLNAGLGFTREDREENLRRIAEVAKLFLDAGVVVLAAFISPLREDRERIRSIVGSEHMVEVYVECPLEVCESRDVKGLYARARKGEIKNFTGLDAPYEAPVHPELTVNTNEESLEACTVSVRNLIFPRIKPQK